jgi:hypothetical protein
VRAAERRGGEGDREDVRGAERRRGGEGDREEPSRGEELSRGGEQQRLQGQGATATSRAV